MKTRLIVLLASCFLGSSFTSTRALAANPEEAPPADAPRSPYTFRPSAMAGLNQWILFGGGNIAAQAKIGRFLVLEYSHGQALKLNHLASFTLTEAERSAGVDVAMPWTTGGGAGIQITPYLHALLEVKAHRYEVRDGGGSTLDYTSITVGPGVFYDLYLYKGLFVQPSLRWWPTVASTYDDGSAAALRRPDGTLYRHERHELLPFVNVNIGWTFTGT